MRGWYVGVATAALLFGGCGRGETGGTDAGRPGGVKADLVVRAVEGPPSAQAGSDVTYTVDVANEGTTLAWSFDVVLEIAHEGATGAADRLAELRDQRLDAGQTTRLSLDAHLMGTTPDGVHRVTVRVELPGEPDTSNNSREAALTVTGGPCAPDAFEDDDGPEQATSLALGVRREQNLCVDGEDWIVVPAEAGRSYALFLEPTDGGWRPLEVEVRRGDTLAPIASEEALGAGWSFVWTAPIDGPHYVVVRRQPDPLEGYAVHYALRVTPAGPDLLWESGPSTVASVRPGGLLPVHGSLRNAGVAEAGASEMLIGLSREPTLPSGQPPEWILGRVPVPPLPPGTVERVGDAYGLPADTPLGTWYVFVAADAGEAVEEFDETNQWAGPVPVEVEALPCAADAFEEDDVPDQAKRIDAGETQVRSVCDDGIDWIRVSVTEGSVWQASVRDTSLYVDLELYDATSARPVNYGGNTTHDTFRWRAPADGEVLLRASTRTPAYSEDGSYTLVLQELLPGVHLTMLSVLDPYWTDVVAGAPVTLWISVSPLDAVPTVPLQVDFIASEDDVVDAGDLVLASQRVPPDAFGYQWIHAALPWDVVERSWYLGVRLDPEGVLDVPVFTDVPPLAQRLVGAPACELDAYEPDDAAEDATQLELDVPVEANHCDDAVDWWQMDLEAGVPYRIAFSRLGSTSPAGHLQVRVWEPEATEPYETVTDWQSGELLLTPPVSGAWHLEVADEEYRIPESSEYRLEVGMAP